MSSFDRSGVEALLIKAGSIITKYEAIAKETGRNFNIFEITRIENKEVMICRVLSELLDPKGRHGQGAEYLELFLREPDLRDHLGLDEVFFKNEIENMRVTTERYTDNGRQIDIAIEGGGRFIPIEVKIYAVDQHRQCYDYCMYARKHDKKAKIVYLTRFGEAPAADSKGDLRDDDVVLISFDLDILRWIEKCLLLPSTAIKNPIREILFQFISSIKKITNQLEDKPMEEMIQLLSESEQNMRSAKAVADTLEKCRLPMARRFFSAISEKMQETLERTYVVDHEVDPSNRLGLVYLARHDIEPGIDLVFVVEAETEYKSPLYAGYALLKDDGFYEDIEIINKCKELISGIDNEEDSPYWVYWDFIEYDGKQIDLLNPSGDNENYYKLFDPSKFAKIIESTVKQIRAILEKLN